MRTIKAFFSGVLWVCILSQLSEAQPIKTTVTSVRDSQTEQPLGRDFRFAVPQSSLDEAGKFHWIYISSAKSTTASLKRTGSTAVTLSITPDKPTVFSIPLAWELKTSGVVENKGIHIWSDSADLSVYVMSSGPNGAEGTEILPTYALGTDYVVAAYNSYFNPSLPPTNDFPSEYTVTAITDNTIVSITTPQNIRNAGPLGVIDSRGVTFTDTLNAGQAIQFQLTLPKNGTEWDVTGTLIRSTNPVAVIGASQAAQIPYDARYPNFIEGMIPPIRTWGSRYYTAPLFGRTGGDTFLAIASSDNQSIYTEDSTGSKTLFAQLNQYGRSWRPDVKTARAWTSDKPFMLVQYSNSAQLADSANQLGAPAMMTVPPVDGYRKSAVVLTPLAVGDFIPGKGYIHIAIPRSALSTLRVDGLSLKSETLFHSDGLINVVQIAVSTPGTHTITADSALGVVAYGYAVGYTYAWSGTPNGFTANSPDNAPPVVNKNDQCFTSHVMIQDTGSDRTHLNMLIVDSMKNMHIALDRNWKDGTQRDSTVWDVSVVDSLQDGSLQASVYDGAGNRTIVRSSYWPMLATITPHNHFIGIGHSGSTYYGYDTITNTGTVPFLLSRLFLQLTHQGFIIDSADQSPIPVGGHRIIRIAFSPVTKAFVSDTILIGNGCAITSAIVTGTGGGPDLSLTDVDFETVKPSGTKTSQSQLKVIAFVNSVTIDSIWTTGATFAYDSITSGLQLPFIVKSGESATRNLSIKFHPDSSGTFTGTFCLRSIEAGTKCVSLRGVGLPVASVRQDVQSPHVLAIIASPNPIDRSSSGNLLLRIHGGAQAQCIASLCTALGRVVMTQYSGLSSDGALEVKMDIHTLAPGTYFYRVESAGEVKSGRVVIE